jgi:putative transposase
MPPTFRRKRNRLPIETYRGPRAYFLTVGCAPRRNPFGERRIVEDCTERLRACSEKHGFAILAYCFMPNHLHLLVQSSHGSDLPQFMKAFKQETGYSYRRPNSAVLWQKSYYDHVLRAEEDIRETARYIIANPVRAALVTMASDYPYSGSLVWGPAILEA